VSTRHFKHDAESELGTGVVYVEIVDDWASRQVEVYGDTWRWADEANPSGLADQSADDLELDDAHAIPAAEFEQAWKQALDRFGRAYRMTVDAWDDAVKTAVTVDPLRVDDFDAWLDRLDARAHTRLVLSHPSIATAQLAIGGGAGHYVVAATAVDGSFWSLSSEGAVEDGRVLLVAGGHEREYPARYVVTAEQARAAGHAYLASGRLDVTQTWDPTGASGS
jgi:hypothetical protein